MAIAFPVPAPSAPEPIDVVVNAFLAALRARDPGTCEHVRRVAALGLELAAATAPELATTPWLWHAFVLHDVGKIGLPDFVFDKSGPLEDSERAILQTHPLVGGQMIEELGYLPPVILEVVTCHHERWDGAGYPLGLEGCQIPLAARIFSVVDAFDAMTNDRVYKQALPVGDALTEIERCSGTQFDPLIAQAFVTGRLREMQSRGGASMRPSRPRPQRRRGPRHSRS